MDLEVETALLRQAADVVDDAATAFAGDGMNGAFRYPLTNHSLGHSAAAREVVEAASRRVQHATKAARQLAELALDMAARLRVVATAFETAENSAIAPPR